MTAFTPKDPDANEKFRNALSHLEVALDHLRETGEIAEGVAEFQKLIALYERLKA